MVSVVASSASDCGFIGVVMVNVLSSSVVDRGFIGGVMVSVFASSAVYRGFEPRSGQNKVYNSCICYFSAKHTALRKRNKVWLA